MKGLLLKDWFVLRQYSPMLVLVLAVYAALDWAGGGGMMAALCMGLCAALPLSVLSANRPCRWDAFAQCLPVSRGVRVLETYAFTALLLAASLLAGVALSVPSWMQGAPWSQHLRLYWQLFWAMVLFHALLLPLVYKLGVDKARYALLPVFLLIVVAAVTAGNAGFSFDGFVSGASLWILPLAGCALYAGSCALSREIYRRKEL